MVVSQAASLIIMDTVCLILVLTSLIGNTLVILTVLLNKPMQTTLNYLLVNLAVADMVFALSTGLKKGLFQYLTHPEGEAGRWLCVWFTHGDIAWFGAAASIFFLVYIAIERYLAIIHPLRHRGKFTKGRLKLLIGIAWFVSIVINMVDLLEVKYYYFDSGSCERCGNFNTTDERFFKAHSLIWMLFGGVVPVCIMVCLYSRVAYRLWVKPVESAQLKASQTALLRHRKQVTVSLLVVSAIYAFCWIPALISHVTMVWGVGVPWFNDAGEVLIVLNSCVNPGVYSLRIKSFREHLRNVILCRKRRKIRAPSGLTVPGIASVVCKPSAE